MANPVSSDYLRMFLISEPSVIRYPVLRPLVKSLLTPADFDTYGTGEKVVLARAFLADRTKRLTVLSADEENLLSIKYNTQMREHRKSNLDVLTAKLWNTGNQNLLETYTQHFDNYINGFDLLQGAVAEEYLPLLQ